MISVDAFGRLDPLDYFDADEVHYTDTWQFLDRFWHHAGVGFSSFLATPEAPAVTRCICVDFTGFPTPTARRLLHDLGLPIRPGMTLADLQSILGAPIASKSFVADRTSYEFQFGPFTIDATVQHKSGLSYLYLHPPLPPENIPDEYGLSDE